jgi:hypothetical protein
MTELQPCAMLANGPPWIRTGLFSSVLEHRGHSRRSLEVACGDLPALARLGDDDARQPLLEILQVTREAEDRHDLRGRRDVEARLPREAVGNATQTDHHVAQRAVVHVEDARPEHPAGVNAQRVAPVDVVVEHGGKQVVRRRDGVEVSGEMKVDLRHRHDLRQAATGRSTLLAEAGAEAGLAQRDRRLLAQPAERIAEADRRRCLALTRLRGIDRRHQDQVPLLAAGERLHEAAVELGLVAAVGFECILGNAQPARNLAHRLLDRVPRYFDIGHATPHAPSIERARP